MILERKILGLSKYEWQRSAPLILYFFFTTVGFTLGKSVRDSLFLLHPQLGPKLLPYTYLWNSLFGLIPAVLLSYLSSRLSLRLITKVSYLGFLLIALLCRFLAIGGKAWEIITLYLLLQALLNITLVQSWTLASELFDTRESKRVFPLLSASATLGSIAGGFSCKGFIVLFNNTELFSVWIFFSIIAGLLLYQKIIPSLPVMSSKKIRGSSKKFQLKEDLNETIKRPLPKTLLIYLLFLGPVFSVINYQFSVASTLRYSESGQLTSFFGFFNGMIGLVSIIFQFLLTPVLLRHLGVSRTIIIHPAFLIFSTFVMTISFGFYPSCLANGGNLVLLNAIHDSTFGLLLNALPPLTRSKARNWAVNMIRPITSGLAFLILTIFIPLLNNQVLAGLLIIPSFIGLVIALKIKNLYVTTLLDTLMEGSRDDLETLDALKTKESLEAMRIAINSEEKARASSAILIAAELKLISLLPEIRKSLSSNSALVRASSLEALGLLGNKTDIPSILVLAKDPDPSVRKAAIESAGLLKSEFQNFLPFLNDPDQEVKKATIISLLRLTDKDGIEIAYKTLDMMILSEEPKVRAMAAKILGETRLADFTPSLLWLLNDSDLIVKRRACRALGKIGKPVGSGKLVQLLGDPYLEQNARYNLVYGIGEKAIPALTDGLESSTKEIRRGSAKTLAKIANKECEQIFMRLLDDDDPHILDACLEGLAAYRSKIANKEMEDKKEKWSPFNEDVKKQLKKIAILQTKNSYRSHKGAVLLQNRFHGIVGKFLVEIVKEDGFSSLKRAVLSLSLLTRPETALEIWNHLEKAKNKELSLALEAFENLGAQELIQPLLPFFDPQEKDQFEKWALEILKEERIDIHYFLELLSTHHSDVIRAACAFALLKDAPEESSLLKSFKKDKSPIVVEVFATAQ
ncbi:MAG: HEAT repeat domain-containing protein [Elusimicrobia bacterium]|nr:HEAT repeat domain-containing protein [Elusimicrobiota bacterium]